MYEARETASARGAATHDVNHPRSSPHPLAASCSASPSSSSPSSSSSSSSSSSADSGGNAAAVVCSTAASRLPFSRSDRRD